VNKLTGRVDRGRGLPGVGREVGIGGVVPGNESRGVLDGDVADGDVVGGGLSRSFASDETAPGFVALVDDLGGVLLVLSLTREGEGVLGLSIGDLVDAEPLVGGTDETGEVPLDVLDVVQLGGKGVLNIDDNDLPVGLTLIEESHDTEHLDLLDLANVANLLADLADIERVVVALGLGLGVRGGGILPGLRNRLD
jgi:hypothetical protein